MQWVHDSGLVEWLPMLQCCSVTPSHIKMRYLLSCKTLLCYSHLTVIFPSNILMLMLWLIYIYQVPTVAKSSCVPTLSKYCFICTMYSFFIIITYYTCFLTFLVSYLSFFLLLCLLLCTNIMYQGKILVSETYLAINLILITKSNHTCTPVQPLFYPLLYIWIV